MRVNLVLNEPRYHRRMGPPSDQNDPPSTGHSRQLRVRLRAARERKELTQQQVANAIAERLGLVRGLTGATVSSWKTFVRHPPIDVMAVWARVVGLRLVVDLDDAKGTRIPVLLRARTAELARTIDAASDDDFEMLEKVIHRMIK